MSATCQRLTERAVAVDAAGAGLWALGAGLLVSRPFAGPERGAFAVFCRAGAGISSEHALCALCCASGVALVLGGAALLLRRALVPPRRPALARRPG